MTKHPPVVFITGATSGFGEAMARTYVGAGARVVVIARQPERLAALTNELGDLATGLALDVADAAAVCAALASLPPAFAEPTIVVNNAGVTSGGALAPDAELGDWERAVDTNIRGVLNMTHTVLPGLVERNHGDIVNIGSISAQLAYPTGSVYGASKAFVRQFTRNLRSDLLGKNVRAMCIEPGTARTGFASSRLGAEAAREFYKQPNLLEAQDVADIVFFCTSLPRRVNVNLLEVMPISQAFAFPAMARDMPVLSPED